MLGFVQLGLGHQFALTQGLDTLQIIGGQLRQFLFQRQVFLVALVAQAGGFQLGGGFVAGGFGAVAGQGGFGVVQLDQ